MSRTVGVEEELLLVDVESGRPRSVAGRIMENVADAADDGSGGSLTQEFKEQQLETDTAPHEQMRSSARRSGTGATGPAQPPSKPMRGSSPRAPRRCRWSLPRSVTHDSSGWPNMSVSPPMSR